MPELRLLAICGSLRKASYNRAALNALVALAPADIAIAIRYLDDIPIFSQDVLDASGYPPPVAAFREEIKTADGVVIATPEYYHSFPGVLKNAIDWTGGKPSVFAGKPVAIFSSSPSVHGGSRAQYDLRKVLQSLDGWVLARPELFIGGAESKYDHDGRLTDDPTGAALLAFLAAFRDWILRLRPQVSSHVLV